MALAFPLPVQAQDAGETEHLTALQQCRTVADDTARLACFDRETAVLIAATDSGDLQIVDREAVRETRRGLFGFSLPKLGIFGGNDDEGEELAKRLESEIVGVRSAGREAYLLTIAEGSVWRVSDAPRRFRPKVGDAVEFERAAMGSYWVRLNGQLGVKGRRVE